jgi:hypothetical protein
MRKPSSISDSEIISAYKQTGNVWKAAELLETNGQAVHKRLVKLNANTPINKFTELDAEILKQKYDSYVSEGKLDILAQEMGRTRQFLCRQAKKLGLTNRGRNRKWVSEDASIRMKKWHSENEHPKGSLGMKHTEETKKVLSEKSKQMWVNMTEEQKDARCLMASINARKVPVTNRQKASWKAGWREIGIIKKYYRSRWEANYARYLQWLLEKKAIAKWEHEPEVFWFEGIKRGCVSYLPDFRVTELDGTIVYHEVKGWMDDASKTKIKRMAKYHPKIKLIVIQKKEYMDLKKKVSCLIPDWEE